MKLKTIRNLIKFNQMIIALSIAYTGLLFSGRPEYDIWLLVTVAVISSKIVHLSFHKIMDNKTNKKSPRYRDSLIPQGEMKKSVLWLYGIFSSAIFIFSSFLINELCYYFSISAVFLMIVFPFLKRYSSLPYYYFGIFESVCPVGGFLAANNRFDPIPFILAAAIFLWLFGLEISRAIYELKYDIDKKIFTIPAKIGANKAQILSIIFYLFSISALIIAGISDNRGLTYWISLICFAIIFIRQELLLKSKDAETAELEFLQINNFIAPIIFIGTLIDIYWA